MSLFTTIFLVAFFVVGWLLLRRSKKHDNPSNRYRHYPSNRSTRDKPEKIRVNRYSKPSRREPDLDHQKEQKDEPPKTPKKPETKPHVSKEFNALVNASEDPDVILGLKEPPTPDREKPIPNDAQITLKPPPPPPPVMTLHVMAAQGQVYNGYELLQTILSAGLRFGQHQIFHRHETKTGHGQILFSLSSAVKPGTFDLETMGNFSTPGLSLFFVADQVDDPIAVYELMLQTAGQFIEDLNGKVLDEHRKPLTPARIVDHRQRLRRYIEAQHVPDLFETLGDQ